LLLIKDARIRQVSGARFKRSVLRHDSPIVALGSRAGTKWICCAFAGLIAVAASLALARVHFFGDTDLNVSTARRQF
jgi:hypothetical protein